MAKKPCKPKRYAEGGGTYSDEALQGKLGAQDSNPYTYGFGPEKLYNFNRSTTPLINTVSPDEISKASYNALSDTDKYYLSKKWGLWSGTDADTGQKGVADTLEDINRIITYKGGTPVSDYSGVSSSLQPLIAKRNAKGGLGSILGVVAPIALSFLAPGIGTALGTALGTSAAAGTALAGAGLGAAGGAISGGGLKGALMGAAAGGLGGYLTAPGGGISSLNNTLGYASQAPNFVGPVQGPLSNLASSGSSGLSNLSKVLGGVQDSGILGGNRSQAQNSSSNQTITLAQLQQLLRQTPNFNSAYGAYSSPIAAIGRARGGVVRGGLSNLGQPRMVQGPGDGMSDDVPAVIGGTTPALLSDSEHVTPALQVSLLGRGSPKAGSQRIEDILNKEIRKMYGNNIDPKTMQDKAMRT